MPDPRTASLLPRDLSSRPEQARDSSSPERRSVGALALGSIHPSINQPGAKAKQARKKMARKRTVLLALKRTVLLASFPPGTITPEEASGKHVSACMHVIRACMSCVCMHWIRLQWYLSNELLIIVLFLFIYFCMLADLPHVRLFFFPDALREAGGDVDKAKRAIAARIAAGHSPCADQNHQQRVPPRHSTAINNLSDRQYCCVWSVETFEDGFRPDIARTLLATVARHVNPILRERGWRVKRLIESASTKWIGLCTGNGRDDADAASVNIQLNLRVEPSKHCRQFRPFKSILAVMLHEIAHVSIGLEDIHPPAFYELLDEIKAQYREKLLAGEVDSETDDYGANGNFITGDGKIGSVAQSAADVLGINGAGADLGLNVLGSAGSEGDCGASKKRGRGGRGGGGRGAGYSKGYTSNVASNEKKRPLLKGAKMVDKRTKVGKAAMRERENMSARDLAAKAALARFGDVGGNIGTASSGVATGKLGDEICIDDSSDDDGDTGGKIKHGAKKDDKKYSEEGSSDSGSVGEEDEEEAKDDDDEAIADHDQGCGCRCCHWSKMFFLSEDKGE